ncbi:hypothetical protein M9H77_00735 [Catharanthus roseus]|uniref:Uncharacterized protein n=1 Tax=Catharanthus roseus TaxID=4058 RepID=A0ACC0C3I6_CATRO|nr:hypothetical protein M9H77_00735 [Catharanthus roseus]
MAVVRYSQFTPMVVIQKSASTKSRKPLSIVVMSADSKISVNRTPFQIKLPSSSTTNQVVFEDQTRGIVCYRDENGEITCEGFDEGPRFQHRISRFALNPRDADFINLLQRSWLQIADDSKLH